ncbi:LodA/GoxA family CTQ-dependent oxidase [Cryptosporangium japonicum]|uniref:VWFA domain-containing protein n=1 Tax=Cryptosporangium japonicum TaxID=80872 RepID=A0ABP3DRG0_9ACTN
MATTYRIHPAIGIARLGNSPDAYFVGPERPGERPSPGTFKDEQLRVKRQAARFRIFAHHDDGTTEEITSAQARIGWTVHLANRKATNPAARNDEPDADLVIDPGPRTVEGPDQRAAFDTGVIRFAGQRPVTVPLGEVRTEPDGRLLVLGGSGTSASPGGNLVGSLWNPGWYDDASDGPVSATLTLPDGSTPPVEGAWVIVAPPKFAPHQDSVVSLHDRLLSRMVALNLVPAPTTTSYTADIYPILTRAADVRWVQSVGRAHSWAHPVTEQRLVDRIVAKLRPAGNMPALAGEDSALTDLQHAHVARWKAGNYARDWTGVPTPPADVTPGGADRAALEACVGGAFAPGIEAGGENDPPILTAKYTAAFRLDHTTVAPGALTSGMSLPWQDDFSACGDSWWPAPRPNDVLERAGATTSVPWDREVGSGDEMVVHWHTLGFVVPQGDQQVETEHHDAPAITLLTPHLDFADVEQGLLGMIREELLPIRFSVRTATTLVLTAPAHPQLTAVVTEVTVDPDQDTTAEFPIAYRTGVAPSTVPTQTFTVTEPSTGRTWPISVDANTVARRPVATALVLDRSGSLAAAGRGTQLRKAAQSLVNLLPDGDGVGIVGFADDAEVLQPVLPLDAAGRAASLGVLTGPGLDPNGKTSVGDGVTAGQRLLESATAFGPKALVVLTDGVENAPKSVEDVFGETSDPVHAIEIGPPNSIGVPVLGALAGNTNGTFRTSTDTALAASTLQVLAEVTGSQTVTTANGRLAPGAVRRIPFQLTDADSGIDVLLLTPTPDAVDFRLQTPIGELIEPWQAIAAPSMRFGIAGGVTWFRLALPVQQRPGRFEQAGTWHVVITPGRPRTEPAAGTDRSVLRGATASRRSAVAAVPEPAYRSELERAFAVISAPAAVPRAAVAPAPGLAYALRVHTWSALSLVADVTQFEFAPRSPVELSARLVQSGRELTTGLSVSAEITPPTGPMSRVALTGDGGFFNGSFTVTAAGSYQVRFVAQGKAANGQPFTRERLGSAAAWVGETRPPAEG